jgi:hypothetical protein
MVSCMVAQRTQREMGCGYKVSGPPSSHATRDSWILPVNIFSVFDTDGEFLLIEAAESLPTWVKPSNSENRVRVYHLSPAVHSPDH